MARKSGKQKKPKPETKAKPQPKTRERKSTARKKPTLTIPQSRFAKAFMRSRSLKEAAIEAGLSPKNPSQSGYQALKGIQKKVPEVMDELGLSVRSLIQNHLYPLLNAKQTKFAQEDGEFTDSVDVEDNDIRDRALDKAFRLHGAYAPKDAELAAQVGVKVIIVDVPRPQRKVMMDDVGPSPLPSPNGNNPNGQK